MLTRTLLASVAVVLLGAACSSGGSGALRDEDGGVVKTTDGGLVTVDGSFVCPATPPSGTCSSSRSQSCGYGGCMSCQCFDGRWQCEAPGCASSPGEIVIRVIDQNGAPVRGVTFTEKGQALVLRCEGLVQDAGALDAATDAADAGPACLAWVWDGPPAGVHDVVVSAPGYGSTTLSVEAKVTAGGCCGPQGEHVDREVVLAP